MKMHFGKGHQSLCQESVLLGGTVTGDFRAVDCMPCLWKLFAETMKAADTIAFTIKMRTDERASKVLA
jgi:hypothetical protein